MSTLTIAARFCGPPGTANGGYLCGLLAQQVPQPCRIRLEQPVPLEIPLEFGSSEDGELQLRHGSRLLARAWAATADLAVPEPPDYVQALDASRRFAGFDHHFFPGCFVCGTERARGDGLRIFAGAVDGRPLVAAPWVPDASLAADDGKVRAEFMAAALDCPGCYAVSPDPLPLLLGEFTAHVDRCVHIDETCIVVGWRIHAAGRKYEVGTALFGEDGGCCARARAVWIQPRRIPG